MIGKLVFFLRIIFHARIFFIVMEFFASILINCSLKEFQEDILRFSTSVCVCYKFHHVERAEAASRCGPHLANRIMVHDCLAYTITLANVCTHLNPCPTSNGRKTWTTLFWSFLKQRPWMCVRVAVSAYFCQDNNSRPANHSHQKTGQ